MNTLTLKVSDFPSLASSHGKWHISIYLPTHERGLEVKENPIRFKSLLKQAEHYLREKKYPSREIDQFMQEGLKLVQNSLFWTHQKQGLCFFYYALKAYAYTLLDPVEEVVIVADSFYLRPLIQSLYHNEHYYLLLVNRHFVQLLLTNSHSTEEVPLQNCPKSLEEIKQFSQYEKHLEFHTKTPHVHGNPRAAMFHGQGLGEREEKEEIHLYLKKIAQATNQALQNEKAPLLLVSDPELAGVYRQENTYPHFSRQFLHANPVEISEKDLLKKAREILLPLFKKQQDSLVENYLALTQKKSPRASHDVHFLLEAAFMGKIETLFIDPHCHLWGTFDPESKALDLHSQEHSGDTDLLDLAARHTLIHRGKVLFCEKGFEQFLAPMAAIFRYDTEQPPPTG